MKWRRFILGFLRSEPLRRLRDLFVGIAARELWHYGPGPSPGFEFFHSVDDFILWPTCEGHVAAGAGSRHGPALGGNLGLGECDSANQGQRRQNNNESANADGRRFQSPWRGKSRRHRENEPNPIPNQWVGGRTPIIQGKSSKGAACAAAPNWAFEAGKFPPDGIDF
jgi:hypothetical protein